jgi:hypothetical protein
MIIWLVPKFGTITISNREIVRKYHSVGLAIKNAVNFLLKFESYSELFLSVNVMSQLFPRRRCAINATL